MPAYMFYVHTPPYPVNNTMKPTNESANYAISSLPNGVTVSQLGYRYRSESEFRMWVQV